MKFSHLKICFALVWISAVTLSAAEFYVAPGGSDTAPGTLQSPFRTVEKARDAARALRESGELGERGVTLYLRGGVYVRSESLQFTEVDSGTMAAPTTIRPYENETVRIIGGGILPAAAVEPVAGSDYQDLFRAKAVEHIRMVSLRSFGPDRLGRIARLGHSLPVRPAPTEFFWDGAAQRIAQYPNTGMMAMGEIVDEGSRPRWGDREDRGGTMAFSDDRHREWVGLRDVWFQGLFAYGFADDMLQVAEIDPVAREVTFAEPHLYGLRSGKPFNQYVALNIRRELDAPGEYFVDLENLTLFFYPPESRADAELAISILEDPIVSIRGASHLVIRDLVVEYGRGIGIQIEGGSHVTIAGCTVRNVGTNGIFLGQGARQIQFGMTPETYRGEPVSGRLGSLQNQLYLDPIWNRNAGSHHRIVSNDVYHCGVGGIYLSGGDKASLTPGHAEAINNRVFDYNRRAKFLWSGINVDGVGHRIAHNEVFGSDYQGIYVRGNEHVFEYNYLHDLGKNSDDTSPWYIGRDPSDRGTVIRYNYFKDIGRKDRMTMGVYFDDATCGALVHGNVFYKVASYGTVYSNAGSDLKITNNIFIEGMGPAFHLKSMWFTWATGNRDYYFGEQGVFPYRLQQNLDITSSPYAARYPRLTDFMQPRGEDEFGPLFAGMFARRNVFARNITVDYDEMVRLDHSNVEVEMHDNHRVSSDVGFHDFAAQDFRLKDDASVYELIPEFERIPFDKIGLFRDEYRTRRDYDGSPWIAPEHAP
jgi:hypothetical protein